MSVELSWLSATVGLFVVYILGEAYAGHRQYSGKELLSARDNLAPYGPLMGRAKRATANMVEAMCMFVPLVLLVEASGRSNQWTELGAAIFFFARLAFAPLYWFGVPAVRSLVFFVGVVGLVMMFLQVLPFSGVS
ncbi:MAPEG family protein [Hyphomonas sp. WL0036]|uniref:MAPEG family protein n=1 Tax=Hyphomonas sediminis TaxID=2866160 RepID=UPI001C8156F7|nr:MAPEG family protein [Hyphomonas sediminis]MBY9067799.1 MAPEG family protein [Hyphomonas sediminis]